MEACLSVTKCPWEVNLNLFGDYNYIARVGVRDDYDDLDGVMLYFTISRKGKKAEQITEQQARDLAWAKLFTTEESIRVTQPKIPNEKDQNQKSNPIHRKEIQRHENNDAEEHGQAS